MGLFCKLVLRKEQLQSSGLLRSTISTSQIKRPCSLEAKPTIGPLHKGRQNLEEVRQGGMREQAEERRDSVQKMVLKVSLGEKKKYAFLLYNILRLILSGHRQTETALFFG